MNNNMDNNQEYFGVLPDDRSEKAKSLDYDFYEIASAFKVPAWVEVKPEDWLRLKIRNQWTSSSCVGQAIAKAFEYKFGEPYSAKPIYTNRKNKPDKGMWLYDGMDIGKKIGTVPERLCPSQMMNEKEMNEPVDMSQFDPKDIKKIKAYFYINPQDIDAIAQALDSGNPVVLTFGSNYKEWTEVPELSTDPVQWGHCVCNPKDRTLWPGGKYKNAKAIVIDESWGVGINADGLLKVDGKRLITEEFLKARCTGAIYPIFETGEVSDKPSYNFTRNLGVGLKNDPDVKALQAILSYEKDANGNPLFPLGAEWHTGNYGNMTMNAVKKFQEKHADQILKPLGLIKGTGYFGNATRTFANQEYK